MEFRLAHGAASVGVPHDLAQDVARLLDPENSSRLDPYTDRSVEPGRVGDLVRAAERALEERTASLKRAVLEELRLREWTPWAEQTLRSRLERDPLIPLLQRLHDLCRLAAQRGDGILVFGD